MANVYILLIFIPLIAAVLIVFARFSLLFLKKIDEGEEEEKLLRERQKEIVENMVEGLVAHTVDGRILMVNEAAEKFLNVQFADIKDKNIAEINNPSQLLIAVFMPMEDRKELAFSFKDGLGQDLFYQIIQVPLSKKKRRDLENNKRCQPGKISGQDEKRIYYHNVPQNINPFNQHQMGGWGLIGQ